MNIRVYILLGGFIGADGYLTSAGMYVLKPMLEAIPNVVCSVYQWGNYRQVESDMHPVTSGDKNVVIGYSGGGTRATWLANELPVTRQIDQMILYDPSPKWQMMPIGFNVKRALSYHNNAPMFWPLGGGVLTSKKDGPPIEVVEISEWHPLVQSDQTLHQRTVDKVKALSAG